MLGESLSLSSPRMLTAEEASREAISSRETVAEERAMAAEQERMKEK